MKNSAWLPIVASIGVGAATYSLMTGRAGQLQNMITGMTGMASNNQQAPQTQQNNQLQ
ncbi:hypothetical protein [Bacillus seohaeanensis]|uniref:Uncharacterized protein n=1 Tax=Bacillus seohaeanensis TaxID=284580 RepID=A0ABW5RXY3_9BACI